MEQIVLIILDGWGINKEKNGNAILLAKTPIMDRLQAIYPASTLQAAGVAVGLPEEQMGNSEVGHINLGAGRIVSQPLVRINKAIDDKSYFENKVFLEALQNVKKNDSKLHLMGLLSDGGVHSHIHHLFALLDLAVEQNIKKICIHAILDGRDTLPTSGINYIKELENKLKDMGCGRIVSVMGRYYAMDRDKRWERVQKAYEIIACCKGSIAKSAVFAVSESYENNITDEFVVPISILDENNLPTKLEENDSFIFFNFREDRAREITHALADKDFKFFKRCNFLKTHFVCMMEYEENIKASVAFPPIILNKNVGEILCNNGLKQLRIAETEKYAHVTFFFNGGREEPYEGEERILIPSPRVATYDLKPEMSAYEVTDAVIKEIESKNYDVIILNYANCDMVGHTGMLKPVIKAIETVDECVGRVIDAVKKVEGICIVTADHGNAEQMFCEDGNGVFTAHTTNPVPFILVTGENVKVRDGILADVSPTILKLMGIKKPKEMSGESLIVDT